MVWFFSKTIYTPYADYIDTIKHFSARTLVGSQNVNITHQVSRGIFSKEFGVFGSYTYSLPYVENPSNESTILKIVKISLIILTLAIPFFLGTNLRGYFQARSNLSESKKLQAQLEANQSKNDKFIHQKLKRLVDMQITIDEKVATKETNYLGATITILTGMTLGALSCAVWPMLTAAAITTSVFGSVALLINFGYFIFDQNKMIQDYARTVGPSQDLAALFEKNKNKTYKIA